MLRHFPGHDLLSAIPGILSIRILGSIVPLHLNMGRHRNIIPAFAVVRCFLKSWNCTSVIFRIVKFPQAVQRKPETACFFHRFLHISAEEMIRMRRFPVHGKASRIFYHVIEKFFHVYLHLHPFGHPVASDFQPYPRFHNVPMHRRQLSRQPHTGTKP